MCCKTSFWGFISEGKFFYLKLKHNTLKACFNNVNNMSSIMNKHWVLAVVLVCATSCANSEKKSTEAPTSEQVSTTEQQTPVEVIDSHNANTALDYQGTYQGVLPCDDCQGIKITITLGASDYVKTRTFQGIENQLLEEKGTYSWNDSGNIITLSGNHAAPQSKYFVGENHLRQLDDEGNQYTGELADKYKLWKE